MNNIVHLNYAGAQIDIRSDNAWFNATVAATRFGKEPFDWLRQRDTTEYIAALSELINSNSGFLTEFNKIIELDGASAASRAKLLSLVKKIGFIKTKTGAVENGGGTWMHPKLAVRFAQWLDARFAVWCDMQIEAILMGTHTHHERLNKRHEAASSFKVMNCIFQLQRQQQGKKTAPYHFQNEAKLVNWALAGKFEGLDRDALSAEDLDLLAKLEEQNAVMIGCGMEYEQRKPALKQFADNWRVKMLEVA